MLLAALVEGALHRHALDRAKDAVLTGVPVHARVVLLHGGAQHRGIVALLPVCGVKVGSEKIEKTEQKSEVSSSRRRWRCGVDT